MTTGSFYGFGLLFIVSVFSFFASVAEAELTIESTISGSQEQPKVLSIVPWKEVPEPEELEWRAKTVVADEVMRPIDRQVFKRKSFYHRKLERQVWETNKQKAKNN